MGCIELCRSVARQPAFRQFSHFLHQYHLFGTDAFAMPAKGTKLVAHHDQVGLYGHEFAGGCCESLRCRLFAIHRTAHHLHLFQRVWQRREYRYNTLHGDFEPLVSCSDWSGADSAYVGALHQARSGSWSATAYFTLALLCYPKHSLFAVVPRCHNSHTWRGNTCRASDYHQHCQPICQSTPRGRHCPQHPFFDDTDHRQGDICRSRLFRQRNIGATLHTRA